MMMAYCAVQVLYFEIGLRSSVGSVVLLNSTSVRVDNPKPETRGNPIVIPCGQGLVILHL